MIKIPEVLCSINNCLTLLKAEVDNVESSFKKSKSLDGCLLEVGNVNRCLGQLKDVLCKAKEFGIDLNQNKKLETVISLRNRLKPIVSNLSVPQAVLEDEELLSIDIESRGRLRLCKNLKEHIIKIKSQTC